MKTSLLAVATLATALPISSAEANEPLSPAGDPESAKIRTLVSSIPLAVDRAAYELAKAAFAPQVTLDYTSLWGGTPTVVTPEELITAWQGIVPGFDATWHELGSVTVDIEGNNATAKADVDGRHWIGDALWRPIGHYHWDLINIDEEWRVTRMVFEMTREVGDRSLAAQAMERAAAAK